MDFDKIVNKMKKSGQKLWSINDINKYCGARAETTENYKPYKLIHRLVSIGVLVSIRSGMYLWNGGEKLDPEDFYWPLVKKIIAENYLGKGIVIGEKALALGLRDYSLPETLSVAVPKNAGRLTLLADYLIISQDIRTKKKTLYPLIKKYATKVSLEKTDIYITSPEHALLEALTIRPASDISDTTLVERWLKKYGDSLRESVFAEFIPHRYISASNRLKYLAYDLNIVPLYEMMVRLIDVYGKGCHLSRDFLLGKNSEK